MPERDDLEALSVAWEAATGYDSIATIRRVYDQTERGAYICCFPDCQFARRDPIALWRHVHGGHEPNCLPPPEFVPGEPWPCRDQVLIDA